MSIMEERLWNYIDGTCTPAEGEAIALLIEQDKLYSQKYNELLLLHKEFAAMELDEPPLAFTYNVMEAIRTEQARQPLKAAINTRVIQGIAAFFVFVILLLLVFTFASIHPGDMRSVNTGAEPDIKLPQLSRLFSDIVIKGFLIFDIVLALFLTDVYLRRKKTIKHA